MLLTPGNLNVVYCLLYKTWFLQLVLSIRAKLESFVLVRQAWVTEMASYVKSIDRNHLLEAGLEGFYGQSTPQRKGLNPSLEIGTDFIANNQIPGIDFATTHSYPDQW